MENIKLIKQIQLEPEYYYHLGFPFDLKAIDSSIFSKGYHFGQFASVEKVEDGVYRAVRDPLGIGKLFYTETEDGELHFSEKFVDLFHFNSPIYSVPSGMFVTIGTGGRRELIRNLAIPNKIDETLNGEAFTRKDDKNIISYKKRFDSRLETLFRLFGNLEDEGWTFFVALSGGLDSSIIASKAAQYLKQPIASTLDLGKSEDSEKAQYIAGHLGIKHLVFPTDEEEILSAIDKAPELCQDYRDFNVHCAALNILLATNIKQYVENHQEINNKKVIVLTGDLMNEFTCDYAGEFIDGVEYYKLPRVDEKELQTHLIRGLDTSDREISVFKAFGLECIQPFAVLYDLYTSLHESVLTKDDPKTLLNSFQVDPVILDFIPKVKLRAQVGSRESMGILGICHKKGLNNKTFYKKLVASSSQSDAEIPIFVGRYDVEDFK